MSNLGIAFAIMGQGLLGIFVSILLIMLVTAIISKIPSKDET